MRCCRDCGHVYNAVFRYEETEYSSDYENSLFCSETYRAYAFSLASGLIERFHLRGKRVVEIGCGSGDFLKILCEQGGNEGFGFDPSASAGRAIDRHPGITFVRDCYSADHAHLQADLLCCRHLLEHIESPLKFLRGIKEALPNGKKTGLFVEVPDVMFILKEHSSWDLIYEHGSYFSRSSLDRLLSRCGFGRREIRRTFHDQFLCAFAEPGDSEKAAGRTTFDSERAGVVRHAEIFSAVFSEQVRLWEQELRSLERSEERVVLWGAGSKGVTFLNILKNRGSIAYVVDINERKHGRYIPGSGQKIVPPGFLKKYRPDAIILMNSAYDTEVRKTVGQMELHPKILLVNRYFGQ
jgi:SAM-dependent methyltransferase